MYILSLNRLHKEWEWQKKYGQPLSGNQPHSETRLGCGNNSFHKLFVDLVNRHKVDSCFHNDSFLSPLSFRLDCSRATVVVSPQLVFLVSLTPGRALAHPHKQCLGQAKVCTQYHFGLKSQTCCYWQGKKERLLVFEHLLDNSLSKICYSKPENKKMLLQDTFENIYIWL